MKATMNDRLSSLSNVPICPKLEPTKEKGNLGVTFFEAMQIEGKDCTNRKESNVRGEIAWR